MQNLQFGAPACWTVHGTQQRKVSSQNSALGVIRKVSQSKSIENFSFNAIGYWTTELGGLNQVVHVWKYGQLIQSYLTIDNISPFHLDSYSERAGVRAKLAVDKEWQAEYFQKILPWLQHQDNLTMKR